MFLFTKIGDGGSIKLFAASVSVKSIIALDC
jgi:hypothetical protein